MRIKLAPRSEQIISIPTKEQGTRYLPKQELGEGIYCAEGLVQCTSENYICMIVNMNEEERELTAFPQLTLPPSLKTQELHLTPDRKQILLSKLRLSHIQEGREELRDLCYEFHDIFRLPGDTLNETRGIQHRIPTPSIPQGRAITLKNYRIPEHRKSEVDKQVTQMKEQGIIKDSTSPWNFPILVIPKKSDAAGVKK
ncbi:hypothetical protein ANN_03911 [Periplaneta americana]|uniref:Uncharacterized protein n=1 Tax=Periplaneta americana TaxID=6978 RepID=A0ABQ8T8Y6_PERAM|nr:hypothetical protein ANN_03911 [Periplaneta americana]